MSFFKNITTNTKNKNKKNAVLMGSNTYYSIPQKYRPLDNRLNFIISNNNYYKIKNENIKNNNTFLFRSIEESIKALKHKKEVENLYVIGGESIYNYFMNKNYFDELLLSEICKPTITYGDVFFPKLPKHFERINSSVCPNHTITENDVLSYVDNKKHPEVEYRINHYINTLHNKKNTSENQYLDILSDVIKTGDIRKSRNATTISKFGLKMDFDLEKGFPLLTTKKVYWKGVKEELMWFIRANTDSKILSNNGVNIWNDNSNREFLDNIGLNEYKEGDCGPIYGFQWRHFNAQYKGTYKDYQGKGVDQLQNCIDLINNDYTSRRIFMSAWNPEQMDQMVLPPCHVSYQFYVTNYNKLDCQMYQRSGDLFLGIPFNIASTALLTSIIAKMTGRTPGKISIIIGDAHIYEDHIDQVKEQLTRRPYKFPTLKIKRILNNINNYNPDDFELESYVHHPTIKARMVS